MENFTCQVSASNQDEHFVVTHKSAFEWYVSEISTFIATPAKPETAIDVRVFVEFVNKHGKHPTALFQFQPKTGHLVFRSLNSKSMTQSDIETAMGWQDVRPAVLEAMRKWAEEM
jgi:hypothetical protein